MDAISLLLLVGLWQVRFSDGTSLSADDCAARTNAPGVVAWRAPSAEVTVEMRPCEHGVDMRGSVTPHGKTVTDFLLPAKVRFLPDDVGRVTFPGDKTLGTGYSLKADFFRCQTNASLCAWTDMKVSGRGYGDVTGGRCRMRPLRDPPVAVRPTDDGKAFFGAVGLAAVTNARFAVNRASDPGQCDRVIFDSPHGPLLGGMSLGGKGMLWRIGSASSADGVKARSALIKGCVEGILREAAALGGSRRRVALIRFPSGPDKLGFCPVPITAFRRILREACAANFEYVELKTPAEIASAEASTDTLLVVNPYPETLPAESTAGFAEALTKVREYVRGGGQWLECGGLSFFKALVPRQWHQLGGDYPGLFADLVHWRWKDGTSCALMGVRPRPAHEPWKCPDPFVPGTLRIGGDERGGWVEHGFRAWVKDGESWTTPVVRITTNRTLSATCDDYVAANDLYRPLSGKVRDAEKLERLKRSPLLYLGDPAAKCRRAIPHIPAPSLVHQAHYLRGGFDKQYPDHLPPRASFGTMDEFRAFVDELHAAGHLYSPYTNPTWWCDHPRGPTFIAAGESPLSIDADGKHIHECYGGKNEGWTICFWHPAVQTANRETRRQFTVDIPVDVLFQDQCGARRRHYDFNPAAPHPTAYLEGVISMVEEDSRTVPLATEDGWDRVAREETAMCGLSWRTVPIADEPSGQNVLEKTALPAHLWEIEPLPCRLFHGTCLFYLHDLGGFVRNERTLAWCLALGYQLSFSCNAWHFTHDAKAKAWYSRLHKVQQDVVAKYAGRKLVSFRHDRSSLLARSEVEPATRADDGAVIAEYEGGLRLVVNLGDVERVVDGMALGPYGYCVSTAK